MHRDDIFSSLIILDLDIFLRDDNDGAYGNPLLATSPTSAAKNFLSSWITGLKLQFTIRARVMVHNNSLPTESQAAWTFKIKVARRRPIMLEGIQLGRKFH
ncbi:hypothetical protein N9A77_00315 [bacterium]|nr:hypothetical protein [bacterium]MDB4357040.1 hypothetical protein [Mariniblastus sp.]MDB4380589.1 hypothetical protein [Mariniblastus sp.]